MATKKKTYPTLDELLAKIRKLPDKHYTFNVNKGSHFSFFPGCCGINVLVDINGKKIDEQWLITTVIKQKRWRNKAAGLIFCSDNTPRPDLEAIGFQFYRSFKNPKTRRTVYTYAAENKDVFGKLPLATARKKVVFGHDHYGY